MFIHIVKIMLNKSEYLINLSLDLLRYFVLLRVWMQYSKQSMQLTNKMIALHLQLYPSDYHLLKKVTHIRRKQFFY